MAVFRGLASLAYVFQRDDPIFEPVQMGAHQMPGVWRYLFPEDFHWLKLPDERHATCDDCYKVKSFGGGSASTKRPPSRHGGCDYLAGSVKRSLAVTCPDRLAIMAQGLVSTRQFQSMTDTLATSGADC